MVVLLAALALAAPPKATLSTATGQVPLVLSSWCWRSRCGAPFSAAKKTAVAPRGSLVTVELGFVPKHGSVTVAGRRLTFAMQGRTLSWRATRGGGVTVHVTGPRGWVTYVGRMRLR